jgi:hypothetical protein
VISGINAALPRRSIVLPMAPASLSTAAIRSPTSASSAGRAGESPDLSTTTPFLSVED